MPRHYGPCARPDAVRVDPQPPDRRRSQSSLRREHRQPFLLRCALLLAKRAGDLTTAQRFYVRALPYTKALKAETGIVQSSASHANAVDGMEASLISAGWKRLGAELGVHE